MRTYTADEVDAMIGRALARERERVAQQEPVAEVKAKMTGGNVGIATVIHEIHSPMRHPLVPGDLLYACSTNQPPVGWIHSRTGLFYSLSVKPDESGLLDEPTDKALLVYTSPPAQRKPLGFAGVTVWVGDAVATQIVTEVAIQHERVPSQSITMAAQRCVDMLAANGTKGKP